MGICKLFYESLNGKKHISPRVEAYLFKAVTGLDLLLGVATRRFCMVIYPSMFYLLYMPFRDILSVIYEKSATYFIEVRTERSNINTYRWKPVLFGCNVV